VGDRLRLVSLRWPKPPSILADLAQSPRGQQVARDTFSIKMGDATPSLSASTTRWGGSRVVGERRQNATLSVTLLIQGDPAVAVPKDSALTQIESILNSALASNLPDLAIEWRPDGATYSTYWRLRGPVSYGLSYAWVKYQSAALFPIDVSFPVAPLAEGAPCDIVDDFSIDTIALGDWAKDAGVANLSIQAGALAPSQTSTTPTRYHHTRGYPYGDVEVLATIKTGATLTNGVWSVCLAMDQGLADTMICLELTSAGSNLVKWVAGVRTILSSAGSTAAAASTSYFLLLRRAGNILYWRVSATWNWTEYTVEPNTYMLTGADLALAGPGWVGLKVSPADVNERYDDFSAKPWVYRGILTPEHVKLLGKMVGDAPALADIEVTPTVTSNTNTSIFGLLAWSRRPRVSNLCHQGDFSTISTNVSPLYGWTAAAVSGVIGASTSVARNSTAVRKYGRNAMQVVTPATTDTGVSWQVARRFKRGQIYAAWAWLAAASGTTVTRVKLGVSGDIAVEAAVALSTTPTLHCVTWQPTADYDFAYMAIGVNAATATTFDSTGMNVVEVPTITLAAAIASTSATSMSVYYTPCDVPFLNPDGTLGQPFLVLIEHELVLVTAIAGNVWTIARGQEATTAATHVVDSLVIVAPTSRLQYEGKGADAPFGVIEGENDAKDQQSQGYTRQASANFRGGAYMGAGTDASGQFYFYVDPALVDPDEFAQGDLLLEVWADLAVDPVSTFLSYRLSAEATETYNPDIRTSDIAGARRYTLEHNSALTTIPNSSGSPGTPQQNFLLLGTIPLVVDPANPQRVRLKLELNQGTGNNIGPDYLIVTPARSRASTPTGKSTNDTSYPAFLPLATTYANGATKIARADGSGAVRIPRLGSYTPPFNFPDSGLGHQIELPNAPNDLVVKLSQTVPNDPGGSFSEMPAGSPNWTAMIHVAATPRFAAPRGS
jgi:hypothetical protein